jgi:homoserine O-succinyltransferase
MLKFYTDFSQVRREKFDGLIITGAPVEDMAFEEVAYWDELRRIMDWSRTNAFSTLHICWGAQAGLYHHYGIQKHPMEKKVFGVFPHTCTKPYTKLMRGFDDVFFAPHSRHTEVRREDLLAAAPRLEILSESDEAGVYIVASSDGKQIFVMGHSEYDDTTLGDEYFRDRAKGRPIEMPKNYFVGDDPNKGVRVRWRSHANLLFSNWLNYYVYQETPYDLETL